ncbi:leukocyte receptor cluster member 1 [Cuculus canorus]|uniref:leukocyte receptor cluster member 1 n=1 Tax=Cuculus canorus TaxID=55661 RepID=UPI0023AABA74|nr:leukocyte receptor cluster member 1 [Cuculus canorus]
MASLPRVRREGAGRADWTTTPSVPCGKAVRLRLPACLAAAARTQLSQSQRGRRGACTTTPGVPCGSQSACGQGGQAQPGFQPPRRGPEASAAMNILPKKSWHVRNRDNVARVRRDEAEAEAERKKRDARALRAEQEARTELLRKKARSGGDLGAPLKSSSDPPVLFPPPGESGGGPNREHEEEKRQEEERRARALGALTYLGQSAAEAQTNPPWYQRPPPGRGGAKRGGNTQERGGDHEDVAEGGRKAALDPLLAIQRGLGRRRSAPDAPSAPPKRSKTKPSIEELRRERLRREEAEAARSRALLGALGAPPNPEPLPDDRERPYNSQFHPHLAKGGRGPPRTR